MAPKSPIGELQQIPLLARSCSPDQTPKRFLSSVQAKSRRLVRAHRAIRPSLRRVLIWNRTEQRAHDLAEPLRANDITIEVMRDLGAVTRQADTITTCTRSHEPLIKGACLRPGTHLDLVGGYTPQTPEADDEAARRSRIFVDRRESAFDGVGDILQPIAGRAIIPVNVIDLSG